MGHGYGVAHPDTITMLGVVGTNPGRRRAPTQSGSGDARKATEARSRRESEAVALAQRVITGSLDGGRGSSVGMHVRAALRNASAVGDERNGSMAGAAERGSYDRAVGPASAWPCRRPSPQFEMTTHRAPLTRRKTARPASAPVRASSVSSSVPAVAPEALEPSDPSEGPVGRRLARPATAVALRINPNWNHNVSHRISELSEAEYCWPHCYIRDTAAESSACAEPTEAPIVNERARRRPRSAAPRLVAASSTTVAAKPETAASACPRAATTSASVEMRHWRAQGLQNMREQNLVATVPRQLQEISRLWHSLCDPGFRVSAGSTALATYVRASGLVEARRTEVQRSWLAEVGSGTVLQLALARRRLAFASQLLPHGMIVQQRHSTVSRLTHAEMLAERKARLVVLQEEEAKWSAEALEAAVELETLHQELEAMESVELEIRRAHAALEAELWTEDLQGQGFTSHGDVTTFERGTSHRVAHRSRCLAGRGRCMLLLGNAADALRDFEAAIVAVPTSLEALWGQSQALEQLGRPTEAAAAMLKHDKLAKGQNSTPTTEPVSEQSGQLAMSDVLVSSLSDGERSGLVRSFFSAGLPALHRTAELRPSSPIMRTKRTRGSAMTAKWMGRKTLMVLLAWQSWASGRTLFREHVKAVLRSAREIFSDRVYNGCSPADLSFVYDLPVAAVASEQNRHVQLTTAAADAKRGCESLLRQRAAWQSGTGAEPVLTGYEALQQETKIAASLEYEAKAHDLQGRLLQMHGQGVQKTIEAMRRRVAARAEEWNIRALNAKRALHNIQKEAVQVATFDDSAASEPSKASNVSISPLFWKVMLGNLTRNARKLDGGDIAADVDRSHNERTMFALLPAAARAVQKNNRSHAAQLNGALDIDMVQQVCSRVDSLLMTSICSRCERARTQPQSPPAPAPQSNPTASLTVVERQLALVDLGICARKTQTPGDNCWDSLSRQLVQHVLKFCEPPGLVAAAATCRQLRESVLDVAWALPQAMADAHAMFAVAELKTLLASMNRQSDFRSAGKKRVDSLMTQAKDLFAGLDAMDLISASLNQRPGAALEFVCEALWQLTSTFMGDDGSAAVNEVSRQRSSTDDASLSHMAGASGPGSNHSTSVSETVLGVGTDAWRSGSWFADNVSMRHRSSTSKSVSALLNGGSGSIRSGGSRSATRWRSRSYATDAQPTQHTVGSRWDLGRKALRAVVSTGFLELDDPGGGPTFRNVLLAPRDLIHETVRRLLPYTAILLGELEYPSGAAGSMRMASINKRVVAGLACFVVLIDAYLRVKCRLSAEVEAVVAQATAARIVEFCGLSRR